MKVPIVKKGFISVLKVIIAILFVPMLLQCQQDKMSVKGDLMGPKEFIPYKRFVADTQKAEFGKFAQRTGAKVLNDAEFMKMKKHIASMYEGVILKNSFVMDNNEHVDCIDINTQPGLRQAGKKMQIQKPPAPNILKDDKEPPKARPVETMLTKDKKDRFGNVMFCERGSIPMRRITLEDMTRFRTLEDFLNKYGMAGRTGIPNAK